MRSPFLTADCKQIALALILTSCLASGAMLAFAQRKPVKSAAYHTPGAGSAERRAIMDALRVPVQKDVGKSIIFVTHDPQNSLRAVGEWAFISAQYVNPDGSRMSKDYWVKFNDMSDDVQALLHRVKGKWKVVTYVVAVTDVEWEDWPKKYGAPKAVVPSTR